MFVGGGDGVRQGVGNAQLLPLEQAQGVVGQHLHALDGGQAGDERAGPAQAVLVVGQAGHQDVPDPEGHPQLRHMPGHGEDVLVRFAGEPAVLFGVDLFQVQDHQAGVLHQLVEGGQVIRVVRAEGFAGRVKGRVHLFLMGQPEKLGQEGQLEQRLAAADRDAALFAPVVVVAPDVGEQLVRRPALAAAAGPGLGVVAVAAAQVAPLQEHDEPDPGAIDRAEALQ